MGPPGVLGTMVYEKTVKAFATRLSWSCDQDPF